MKSEDEFFIGWSSNLGRELRCFLGFAAIAIVGGLAVMSFVLASSITDPARSLLGADAAPGPWQEVTFGGVLSSEPYPFLRITSGGASTSDHGVLLSGEGKQAAAYDRAALENRMVEVKGLLLKRGSIDMLVINESPRLMHSAQPAEVAPPKALGRWRAVGEICDGKCGAGIMSPGTGIAHKACANLCLIGGVPPVLVLTHPLEGHRFMMISDENGRALDDRILRFVGTRIQVEGAVELRGDVALMKMDTARTRQL